MYVRVFQFKLTSTQLAYGKETPLTLAQ